MARKPTEVFGSVIAPNGQGVSPPADDLLERADHALGRQREVNLNAQCLAVEVVDHLEHADFSSSAIDPVHALMVPAEASHIAQIQEAQTKAPIAVVVSWGRS